MSAFGGKADMANCSANVRLLTQSGHAAVGSMLPRVMRMDASLSHATGINQPLRFFKRFVAVEAIKLDRNQIK
jgi:hypothetical protein